MKRKINKALIILIVLLTIKNLGGCNSVSQYDYSPYQHIHLEEEAYLTKESSSPFCDFSIDYSCLNEEDDSIAQLINHQIQREFLGGEYANLMPEAAIDSFKNTYIREYRQEMGELYLLEKSKTTSEEEIPAWFDQTYSLVTFVEEGREGVILATANTFVDMGGAHPNQWSRWLNFDATTGKLLFLENVFKPEAKSEIEKLLLFSLIAQQADVNPDEKVESLEDLQKLGFLQLTNMYIPDNFLLGKEAVSFLFNRYDIAPYSAGSIVLDLPYENIGQFMKN